MVCCLLLLLVVFIALLAYYVKYHYSYWERRGFPSDKNNDIPFGCLKSVPKREKSMGMAIYDVYQNSKEAFVGIHLLYRHGLLVRDVDLARHVLMQDFGSFHDRGIYVDEESNPLSANLFALRGQSWRTMRNKLAPSFSSGKLKGMYSTSEEVGDKMVAYMKTLVPERGTTDVDIKDICTNYAVDIIASTIFGLEVNSFENPNNEFRAIINQKRRNSFFRSLLEMVFVLTPALIKMVFKLGLKNEIGEKLNTIIKDTIEYREKNNIVRRDMLQLLIQLRNTGKINDDDANWNVQKTTEQFKSMPIEKITAQALIFYMAGQETTASTAAFTIFELAQYPELLQRAQKEVLDTLEKHGGKITYDALQEMEFLELCMLETLRKYPGLPILNRECTQDYTIPGTDKVVEKGTPIIISLFGIHRDPEHFPNPDEYIPERFLESQRNYNPNAYMPFGEGPRHCIAQRMGKVNSKLAVVKILQHFNVEIMSKREIEIDNHSLTIVPKHGVKVKLSRRLSP